MIKGLKTRAVDRPDLPETFADDIGMAMFDGQTLRIEFLVTRFDEPKPPAMPTARQYPAARIVLDQHGAVELINQLQKISAALQAAGLLKRVPPGPQVPPQAPTPQAPPAAPLN
jgi:hypothetical protein